MNLDKVRAQTAPASRVDRRWVLGAIVAFSIGAVALNATTILRGVGDVLVTADPVQRADVIVLAVDAFEDGALEVADLVHEGLSTRVAVFTAQDTALQQELRRRDVPVVTPIDRVVETMKALGVSDVQRIPSFVTGTTDSIPVLVAWARAQHVRTVMLVTTTDHSRRVAHVLKRTHSSDLRVLIRPTRYSAFTPDNWWKQGSAQRRFAAELPKLVADIAMHPASYLFAQN